MTQNKLPKDWKWIKLGEVVDMQSGVAFKKAEYSKEGVRLFQIANVSFNYTKWEDVEHLPIGYLESHNHLLLKKGDIVLALNRPMLNNQLKIAELKQSDVPAILYQRVGRFTFANSLNKRYFLYYFQSPIFLKWLGEQLQGVNIPFINKSKLLSYNRFPLPPFETQQLIVSKIEELFSELDKGIEDLKLAQQQLKTYRQCVLKYAFEGKLTNKKVKDGVLPKGWEFVTIGDVCYNVEYGSGTKSKKKGRIPVLRMGNIQNGIFDWSDLVYSDDDIEINKYLLKKNDVLFNRTNSAELVGKTAIYKGERPAIFAGYLIRLNRIEELLDAAFITYYLNSKQAKKHGNAVRSFGVNQSNINGTKLKAYPLSLPPLEEQHLIVEEIESRLSVADKMEESISQSLLQAESLRQSILKKAFSGELV